MVTMPNEIQKPKAIIPEVPQGQQRIFPKDRTIVHDLYKLKVASMLRNISWNAVPENVSIEHCHFFHTVDSDGKVQTTSTAIGGHFHEMEVIPQANGVAKVICKSGPMTHGKTKFRGQWKKTNVPYYPEDKEGNIGDDHTHEVQYISSCEITPRINNIEALKVIGEDASKSAGLPGVL